MLNKEIPPPWVPELNSETDYQYFDDYNSLDAGGNGMDIDIDIGDEA